MSTPEEWRIYQRINELMTSGNWSDALRQIDETREQTHLIAADMACLEARCLDLLGAPDRALSVLEYAAEHYSRSYWVYYALAKLLQNAGRSADCVKAYRKAHEIIGWEESEKNNYSFFQDYFSPNIPVWSDWFAERIKAAPINALEIGSWQGGSTTWLLDRVISKRGGMLTCVDTFEGSSEHVNWIGGLATTIEDIFDSNIAATGHSALCRKIVGCSQDKLRSLHTERFDFIYIDGAHEARYVIEDAILSFGLLKPGGYICFDDYDFEFAHNPRQNTRRAIDAFLDLYEDEILLVEKNRQILLQKCEPSAS